MKNRKSLPNNFLPSLQRLKKALENKESKYEKIVKEDKAVLITGIKAYAQGEQNDKINHQMAVILAKYEFDEFQSILKVIKSQQQLKNKSDKSIVSNVQNLLEQDPVQLQYDLAREHAQVNSFKQAEELFRAAAEQGHVGAQYSLGSLLYMNNPGDQPTEEALKWFEAAANQGHIKAQYNLGMTYLYEGGKQSFKQATKWLEQVTKNTKDKEIKYEEIEYILGNIYYKGGKGIEKSIKEAAKWYTKSAMKGHIKAQHNIACLYDEGGGVTQSFDRAAKWFEAAAKQGNIESQFRLGCAYYNGEGKRKSLKLAVQWFELAAAQGHKKAQYNLGCMYYDGEWVKQSFKQALKWFKAAAIQHHPNAQYQLGILYFSDVEGIKKSSIEACKWFELAAKQNYADAQLCLGILYAAGEGVERSSMEEAEKWWMKAAEQGNVNAQYYLSRIPDVENAVHWLKEAAKQGHIKAQYNLARMYDAGEGVETSDAKEAFIWFRAAAVQGHIKSQYYLASMYGAGKGVEQSSKKAIIWYSQAAAQGYKKAQDKLKIITMEEKQASNHKLTAEKNSKQEDIDQVKGKKENKIIDTCEIKKKKTKNLFAKNKKFNEKLLKSIKIIETVGPRNIGQNWRQAYPQFKKEEFYYISSLQHKEKSKVFAVIDPKILTTLNDQIILKKVQSVFEKGIYAAKKLESGFRYQDGTIKIKIYGKQNVGDYRLWATKIIKDKKSGEKLYIFDSLLKHNKVPEIKTVEINKTSFMAR